MEASYAAKIESAWAGELDFYQLFDFAGQLEAGGQHGLAAVLYETWLSRNHTGYDHFVQFNLGVALANSGDLAGAAAAYQQACQLAPNFLQPHFNLGLLHERQGAIPAAITQWQHVVTAAAPADPEQHSLRQRALEHLGRYPDPAAAAAPAETMATEPGLTELVAAAPRQVQVTLLFQLSEELATQVHEAACRQFTQEALARQARTGWPTGVTQCLLDGESIPMALAPEPTPAQPEAQPLEPPSQALAKAWRTWLHATFSAKDL